MTNVDRLRIAHLGDETNLQMNDYLITILEKQLIRFLYDNSYEEVSSIVLPIEMSKFTLFY